MKILLYMLIAMTALGCSEVQYMICKDYIPEIEYGAVLPPQEDIKTQTEKEILNVNPTLYDCAFTESEGAKQQARSEVRWIERD